MNDIKQLNRWNRDLSRAIGTLGTEDFFPSLVAAVRGQVRIDFPKVWLFHRDLPPRLLYHELSARAQRAQLRQYTNEYYRQDPFYLTAINQPRSKIYRLSRITHNKLHKSPYHQEYYADTGAVDEVAFLAKLQGDNIIVLSIARRVDSGAFSDDDYEKLYLQAEPVSELLKAHSKHNDFAINKLIQPGINHQIDLAFKTFGSSLLSPREKSVLEMMLRGYSTERSAEKLQIAVETLRRHRKSIYRKLDVNSQSDLFSLFINAMSCLGQAAGDDPLSVYMAPLPKALSED